MKGYKTADAAYRAAKKAGLVGVTGSGQVSEPQLLTDGSWGYQTATNAFQRDRNEKSILVKGGKMISLVEAGYTEGSKK